MKKTRMKLQRSLMRSNGGHSGFCVDCAQEPGETGASCEFNDVYLSDLLRGIRKHVRETGHSVCVTASYEFFIEPADKGTR